MEVERLLLLLLYSAILCTACTDRIEWINISPSDAFLMNLDPTGIEGNAKTFLCRAEHWEQNYWVPGKLFFYNGNQLVCDIPDKGLAYGHLKYQVLSAPKGTLSWIRLYTEMQGGLPDAAIPGGVFPGGKETAYICRATLSNDRIIVGKYANGTCWFPDAGKEHSQDFNLEILVANSYAFAIRATEGL